MRIGPENRENPQFHWIKTSLSHIFRVEHGYDCGYPQKNPAFTTDPAFVSSPGPNFRTPRRAPYWRYVYIYIYTYLLIYLIIGNYNCILYIIYGMHIYIQYVYSVYIQYIYIQYIYIYTVYNYSIILFAHIWKTPKQNCDSTNCSPVLSWAGILGMPPDLIAVWPWIPWYQPTQSSQTSWPRDCHNWINLLSSWEGK